MTRYAILYGQSMLVEVVRLSLWLVLLIVIFVPLERLFALRPQRIFRRAIWTDVGYYFINGLLPAVLMAAPLSLVAWTARAAIPHGFYQAIGGAPYWARLLAAFVIGDFAYYWAHRWMHAVPLLWRFHAVHHSAEQLDFLVNTRAHPIDIVIGRMSGLVPLYVLGLAGPNDTAGIAIPVSVVLVGMAWGYFIHANLRWRFGPLAWVLSTPQFHHWHHDIDAPFNKNYASMLPVLDRLFGTHALPDGRWPARNGIPGPMPASLKEQLIEPFLEAEAGPVV